MELNSETWQLETSANQKQVTAGRSWGFAWNWKEAFQILSLTLLSLILPLSFLLLSRLSTVHYILAVSGELTSLSLPSNLLSSVFLYSNSSILYSLLSLFSVAAFVHGLSTGGATIFSGQNQTSSQPVLRPPLYASWLLLCTLQVFVGLGIEGSVAAGIDGSGFSQKRNLLSRVLFFLGLHDTMLFWSRSVVKPVVDDTVLGFAKEERWVERVAMASSFGALWWWKLRDEIDSLVVVAELKRELSVGNVGLADFVGWWLYFLTASIGTIRLLKGLIWLGTKMLSPRNVPGNLIDPAEMAVMV